jgi:hypothetical protein
MDRWKTNELPPPAIEPRTCEHCEAPLRGWWVAGQWQWGTCACRDPDVVRDRMDAARNRPDNALHDPLGEPHDLETRD